jgi:hypothetical protein
MKLVPSTVLTQPPGALTNPPATDTTSTSRGIKRSRSPEPSGELQTGEDIADDGTSSLIREF